MSPTAQSRRRPLERNIGQTATREIKNAARRTRLWIELTRQRARILGNAPTSLIPDVEPETCSDPADQASTEFEQDLAMQVRTRTFDKLRRIEHALQLMRTSGYGQCHRCHAEIPYERLKVQPDTLFCVPCLTLIERNAARN